MKNGVVNMIAVVSSSWRKFSEMKLIAVERNRSAERPSCSQGLRVWNRPFTVHGFTNRNPIAKWLA